MRLTPSAESRSLHMSRWTVVSRMFAAHDVILLAYLGFLALLLDRTGPGVAAGDALRSVYGSAALLIVGCFWGRATEDAPWRGGVYRVAVVGSLVWNYLMLRDVLPVVSPGSVDATLSAIDVAMFGVEPAVWLERYASHGVVEWFSFFYFSYFAICALYMVSLIWVLAPGKQTSEFAIGTALVCCVGQLLYMAVPASGPIVFLSERFHAPVQGGLFWGLVGTAVHAGSAMKDVFPSLHTAMPTWFTLFALRRARENRRWRAAAAVTAFFALNIVASTLILRWHYAIDVFAGLGLAVLASLASSALGARDDGRRSRLGSPPAWSALPWHHPSLAPAFGYPGRSSAVE